MTHIQHQWMLSQFKGSSKENKYPILARLTRTLLNLRAGSVTRTLFNLRAGSVTRTLLNLRAGSVTRTLLNLRAGSVTRTLLNLRAGSVTSQRQSGHEEGEFHLLASSRFHIATREK